MKLIEYPDQEMMMIDVANHLAGELAEYVMHHDAASFAVPGGTTPGPIFDVLCAFKSENHALRRERKALFFLDERKLKKGGKYERSLTQSIK